MKSWIGVVLAIAGMVKMVGAEAHGSKWHPGNYLLLNGGSTIAEHLRHINEIAGEKHIKGVMIRIWWADLEPTKGKYDFRRIETYLKALRPRGKYLVVRVMDRRFNTTSKDDIVPLYFRNFAGGGLVKTSTGYAAALWRPEVMDRLIALYQAIGRTYDADRNFEGLFTEESTLSLTQPFPSGYSHAALTNQYVRFVKAVKPKMPRTNLFVNANWIGAPDLMDGLLQALRATGAAAAGSDVLPERMTLGQRVLTGGYGADYRWELAIANAVEASELGGHLGTYTPEEISDFAFGKLYANYLFWARNTWNGGVKQKWDTGIRPHLRKNPRVRTRCPNTYGYCAN